MFSRNRKTKTWTRIPRAKFLSSYTVSVSEFQVPLHLAFFNGKNLWITRKTTTTILKTTMIINR